MKWGIHIKKMVHFKLLNITFQRIEIFHFLKFQGFKKLKKKKNFMTPFYGSGSTASRLEPLREGSLLFTTNLPEIPGTHFIGLGRMKDWVDLGATQWFWTRDPWIWNPAPWPLGLNKLGKAYFPFGKLKWKHSKLCPCHRMLSKMVLKYMFLVHLCKSIALVNEPKKRKC